MFHVFRTFIFSDIAVENLTSISQNVFVTPRKTCCVWSYFYVYLSTQPLHLMHDADTRSVFKWRTACLYSDIFSEINCCTKSKEPSLLYCDFICWYLGNYQIPQFEEKISNQERAKFQEYLGINLKFHFGKQSTNIHFDPFWLIFGREREA